MIYFAISAFTYQKNKFSIEDPELFFIFVYSFMSAQIIYAYNFNIKIFFKIMER